MADDPEVDDDVKHSESKTDGVESKTEEDEFMKSLPKDPTQTTAKQQRILAKKLGLYQQQTVGESWYPINRKWYDSWKKYIMWDKGDEDIDGGIDAVDDSGIPRPDKIDNTDLAGTLYKDIVFVCDCESIDIPSIQRIHCHFWIE